MDFFNFLFGIPLFISTLLLYLYFIAIYGCLIFEVFGLGYVFNFIDSDNSNQGLVDTGVFPKWQYWVCILVGSIGLYIGIKIYNQYDFIGFIAYIMCPLALIMLRVWLIDKLTRSD